MSNAKELLAKAFIENDKNGGKAWNAMFQSIGVQAMKRVKMLKLTSKVAHAVENVDKNRYRDISPYDQCRVTLGTDGGYINASPVEISETGQKYILCQGPLEETSADFWQMVWEHKVPTIVMLNKLIERGNLKWCAPYYPNTIAPEMTYPPFKVVCTSEKDEDDFTVREISLTKEDDEEVKQVTHLQYTEWPDFGVPRSPASLLHFFRKYWEVHGAVSTHPAVVHCSAGVGRSGTFVVVDSVIRMVEEGAEKVDIEGLIVRLRESRMGLIQTPQQLRYSWHAIISYFDNGEGSGMEPPSAEENTLSGSKRASSESTEQETLAKRRAMITRMVARSRAAEAAAAVPMGGHSQWMMGVVAVAIAAATFYFIRS